MFNDVLNEHTDQPPAVPLFVSLLESVQIMTSFTLIMFVLEKNRPLRLVLSPSGKKLLIYHMDTKHV